MLRALRSDDALVEAEMNLYHRTDQAASILKTGFRDRTDSYLASRGRYRGVWLSDVPLDVNEGTKGDELLRVRIPIREIRQYEWIEEGRPYREFLVPARLVNRYPVSLMSSTQEEAALVRKVTRWTRLLGLPGCQE